MRSCLCRLRRGARCGRRRQRCGKQHRSISVLTRSAMGECSVARVLRAYRRLQQRFLPRSICRYPSSTRLKGRRTTAVVARDNTLTRPVRQRDSPSPHVSLVGMRLVGRQLEVLRASSGQLLYSSLTVRENFSWLLGGCYLTYVHARGDAGHVLRLTYLRATR